MNNETKRDMFKTKFVKVKITTVDDDQGWLDATGINYKVNDIVEMTRAEFDQLNAYANSVNTEVCGPAISVEDVTASQENATEAIEIMKRFDDKSEIGGDRRWRLSIKD